MARRHQAEFLLFAWLLAAAVHLHAQATTVKDPCDGKLIRTPTDPLAYAVRGERCEGVYIREVAGNAGISVVAFTTASKPFDIRKDQPLRVEWDSPGGRAVNLRAVSLRRKLYYRMDATRPVGASNFDWPTNVLSALSLKSPEVGIVGWTDGKIGDRPEAIYLPLHVVGAEPAGPGGEYLVLVVPGTELQELYVTLSAVDSSGQDRTSIMRDKALNRGFYPAERPIPLRLPKLPEPGLYRLRLNAVLSQGAPSPRSLYFRHAGS